MMYRLLTIRCLDRQANLDQIFTVNTKSDKLILKFLKQSILFKKNEFIIHNDYHNISKLSRAGLIKKTPYTYSSTRGLVYGQWTLGLHVQRHPKWYIISHVAMGTKGNNIPNPYTLNFTSKEQENILSVGTTYTNGFLPQQQFVVANNLPSGRFYPLESNDLTWVKSDFIGIPELYLRNALLRGKFALITGRLGLAKVEQLSCDSAQLKEFSQQFSGVLSTPLSLLVDKCNKEPLKFLEETAQLKKVVIENFDYTDITSILKNKGFIEAAKHDFLK